MTSHRDHDDAPAPTRGSNRDRRREAERRRQVVHVAAVFLGHRAGRAADERRTAQVVKVARRRSR